MTKMISFSCTLGLLLLTLTLHAQVKEYSLTPKGRINTDEVIRSKGIPMAGDREIKGDGTPRSLFVVQLARFEFMEGIPEKFPKGAFLWINPDLRSEKLLLAGFFESFEEAEAAAKKWKKKDGKMFATAFARPKPFMVIYE